MWICIYIICAHKWVITALLQRHDHNTQQLKACLHHQRAYVKRKKLEQQNTFKHLHSAPSEVFRSSESITCHGICTMPNSHSFNLNKAKSVHVALLYSEWNMCFMTKGIERLKLFTYVGTEKKHWKILKVYLHCLNKIYFKDLLKLIAIIILLFWITPINWYIEEFFHQFLAHLIYSIHTGTSYSIKKTGWTFERTFSYTFGCYLDLLIP